MNSLSNIRGVANLLDRPILRDALPGGVNNSLDLLSSFLRDLGSIGTRAEAILAHGDYSLSGFDQRLGEAQGLLRAPSQAAASYRPLSENIIQATQARTE